MDNDVKLKDLVDPAKYIYIKVATAICSKFKVGDYIRYNSWGEEDDEGNEFSSPRWYPEKNLIESVQSSYWRVDSARVYAQILYKVVTSFDNYLEVLEVPYPNSRYERSRQQTPEYIFNVNYLRDTIEYMIDDLSSDASVNEIIDNIVENVIVMDSDYADSIIMDLPYTPYEVCEDVADKIKNAQKIVADAEKQIRSEAAKIGWARRKTRQELAAKKAKQDATNAKRAATIAAKKKTVKKVKKKAKK